MEIGYEIELELSGGTKLKFKARIDGVTNYEMYVDGAGPFPLTGQDVNDLHMAICQFKAITESH